MTKSELAALQSAAQQAGSPFPSPLQPSAAGGSEQGGAAEQRQRQRGGQGRPAEAAQPAP